MKNFLLRQKNLIRPKTISSLEKKISHDEYEKDGVTIEMHRDVLFRLTNAYDYFADIWERAIHAKGKS